MKRSVYKIQCQPIKLLIFVLALFRIDQNITQSKLYYKQRQTAINRLKCQQTTQKKKKRKKNHHCPAALEWERERAENATTEQARETCQCFVFNVMIYFHGWLLCYYRFFPRKNKIRREFVEFSCSQPHWHCCGLGRSFYIVPIYIFNFSSAKRILQLIDNK